MKMDRRIKSHMQILDSLPMPDKATMMSRVNAYAKAGITSLDPPPYELPKPRPLLVRRPAMAAALALAIVGVGVGSVFGTDLYRYNTASDFFADHSLSAEGLSRGELWEVYRDITTGSFTLPATGQILQSNMGQSPSGSLSAEEAESMWENWKNTHAPANVEPLDVSYNIRITRRDLQSGTSSISGRPYDAAFYTPNLQVEETLFWSNEDPSPVPKSSDPYGYTYQTDMWVFYREENGTRIWTAPLVNLHGITYGYTEDYVVIAGYRTDPVETYVLMLNSEGKFQWEVKLSEDLKESPTMFLCGDDSITLFSGGNGLICHTVFGLDGTVQSRYENTLDETGSCFLQKVFPVSDGYLLMTAVTQASEQVYRLCRMNQDGVITNVYTFEDGGGTGIPYNPYGGGVFGAYAFRMEIKSVVEANGYLYISITGEGCREGRDMATVMKQLNSYWQESFSDSSSVGIPPMEFVNRVRACYRSFLLVCDPTTMEPLSVTVMDGAYTAEYLSGIPSIEVDADGHIRWVVESPYATIFSPYTSSFSIAGHSYRYTFTLTPEGQVMGDIEITEGSGYRH